MPLRSVEAATRDDAIAAAREQFGATARVVGVRRVRSGGVLGFFATERYVAEVDPDASVRPTGAPESGRCTTKPRYRASSALAVSPARPASAKLPRRSVAKSGASMRPKKCQRLQAASGV